MLQGVEMGVVCKVRFVECREEFVRVCACVCVRVKNRCFYCMFCMQVFFIAIKR